MPTVDPAAALEARLAELDAAIKPLAEERARVERALAALRGLTTPYQHDTVGGTMHERGGYRKATKETKRLRAAAKAARYSLRALAEAVGTNQPHLTRAAGGDQPISRSLAAKVEELLRIEGKPGYPATRENWPKLTD